MDPPTVYMQCGNWNVELPNELSEGHKLEDLSKFSTFCFYSSSSLYMVSYRQQFVQPLGSGMNFSPRAGIRRMFLEVMYLIYQNNYQHSPEANRING